MRAGTNARGRGGARGHATSTANDGRPKKRAPLITAAQFQARQAGAAPVAAQPAAPVPSKGQPGPLPLDNTLQEYANRLIALESDISRTELEKRYAIGLVVKSVSDDSKYGDKGVARLARAARMDRSTLYRARLVAEQWPTKEYAAITAKTGRDGNHLTWSHLEILTSEADGARRRELAERAIKQHLTVKDLQRELGSKDGAQPPEDATPSHGSEVREISAAAVAAHDRLMRATKVLAAQAPSVQSVVDRADLDDAQQRLAQLGGTIAATRAALEGLLPHRSVIELSGRPDNSNGEATAEEEPE